MKHSTERFVPSSVRSGLFFALALPLLSAACTTKVDTYTVKGPLKERRTRIDPSGPLGTSEWSWDGRGFTGNIAWQGCRIDSTWKETEQRASQTKTIPAASYLMAGAGVALLATGLAIYDYDGVEEKCMYGVCYEKDVSNTFPFLVGATGGILFGLGASTMVIRSDLEVEDVKTEQKSASKNGPCITPSDVAELKVVLQVSDKKFVTAQVARDGSARIEIPPGIRVPRNVDLPVLLYTLPRKASHLAGRWHVIGHARAGDGVP